ncbi:type IV secretory system conjugative DNA transfer family protein [Clostridium sardiniense]|uniref:Type IV secretory system conjugative DNA transfer family protein n=1 Tax=Clostridium sardiniense TaxID=29369 RepID=A0ABS7KZR5_CLOSR|nr:type IV secretory system conjugative DNA transfer family protein [Clostridium sardiniense]
MPRKIEAILRRIKITFYEDNEVNRGIKKAKFLASWKFSFFISIAFIFISIILSNIIATGLDNTYKNINNKGNIIEFNLIKSLFNFNMINKHFFVYAVILILTILILIKLNFRLKTSFETINEGQKGTSRFCTLKEVDEQYKSIPEVETEEEIKNGGYDGKGGVVISRFGKRVYIDDSKSNNLSIGTTRSGKGELFLFPTIDAYSRAKEKASLVINDPKGELLGASKETLEKRGYRIEVLNLINPEKSMSYNPLQLIINAYEKGDLGEAQKLCKTLTYAMYYKPNVKDPFWQESAMSLVNALILAVIDRVFTEIKTLKDELKKREQFIKDTTDETLLKKNKEKIIVLKKEIEKTKGKITLYTVAQMLSELGSANDENDNNELDKYFNNLDSNNVAKMQYATSNFAKGSARGSIFSVAMSELQKFTMEKIAKLTAKNSIDLKDIGFNSEKDDRPVALFIILPDYDKSDYVVSSMLIRQLYYVLAKTAEEGNGKCDRDVVYLIDEFGNVPPIEDLDTILTVCLGRRIFFTLVVQALSQIEGKYGKDASKTIIGNCANKIYIITTERDTANEISELLGDKTITNVSRSGEFLDTTKHLTESVDSRKLINANELMLFKEGEMVVIRTLKRRDKKGNEIVPNPIHNHDETRMKYRYEYLGEWFDNTKRAKDVDINCIHNDVKLEDLILFRLDNQILNSDVDLTTPGEYKVKVRDKESENGVKEYKVMVLGNGENKIIDENIEKNKDNKNNEEVKEYKLKEIFTVSEIKKIIDIVNKRLKDIKIDGESSFEYFKIIGKENENLNLYVKRGEKYIKEKEGE